MMFCLCVHVFAGVCVCCVLCGLVVLVIVLGSCLWLIIRDCVWLRVFAYARGLICCVYEFRCFVLSDVLVMGVCFICVCLCIDLSVCLVLCLF